MFKHLLLGSIASLALGLSACSNDPTVNPNGTDTSGQNVVFHQVDRIGKPGIKALYLAFSTHSAYNQAAPGGDVATYGPAVSSFVTVTAGRSPAIGNYVAAVLLPDALIADFTSTATRASYLGWETNGQIASDCTGAPGTTFGGRALLDDVVNTDLGLAFGNLATTTVLTSPTLNVGTPPPDDGKESNGSGGKPNLTNQHVTCPGVTGTPAQFPYLANPL